MPNVLIKKILLGVTMFLWLLPRPSGAAAFAQDVPTPVELHHPLLLKILSFDRMLEQRAGPEIVVGVVYQARFRASYVVKETFMETATASPDAQVKGIPVRCVAIELGSTAAFADLLAQQQVDVLYIAPLRAVDIHDIALRTREHQTLTFTGVPSYVNDGLAVGIDLLENKPKIIINLPAARAEGAAFKAHLLKLAHVIQHRTP